MSLSLSASPAPADSPVALTLSPQLTPLVDPSVSPPPTEAAAPVVLPSQSPPPKPAILENPPQSPPPTSTVISDTPPPPATLKNPPQSASGPSMVISDKPPPPSPSLPSETPPTSPSFPSGASPPAISPPPPSSSLPAGAPPPDPSLPPPSPPRRRRQTPPSLPPPSTPTSPPFPKHSFVPETSSPHSEASTTPLTSSSPPEKSPSSNLPFFRPSDPNPNPNPSHSKSPNSPQVPVTLPNTSSGGFQSSSPPQLLPLVPKSLPETSPPPHPSTGLAFGGIIVGVLLIVLLGLLFVCYRATRNRNHKPATRNSDKTTTSKASKGHYEHTPEDDVQDIPHIISFPQHQTTGSSNSTSVRNHQTQTSSPTMGINISSGTFSYNELADATAGFSESNLLGQGGFGYVHRGVLRNGKEIAVKQLKIGSDQGEREFRAEVDTISRVHHKHLVSLVGYCINGDKRLLVYEFVPNNTLEFHLHGKERHVLEWEMRRRIAIGAAKGLAYLHEDCNPTIIHRDIKASNILLDSNFEAKVSDFGLARLFSGTNSSVTHVSTRVVGTFGYMAPEYALSGKLTEKSDVYSFGVVLLELIMGQPPILTKTSLVNENIVDKARPLIGKALEEGTFDGFVDEKLQRSYYANQMANMVACAAACVRQSAWLRPRMSQIVRALEGEVSLSGVMEGITAGRSTSYRSSETSNDDSGRYRFDMKRFKASLGVDVEGYSGSTSEFGLNSSCSSCQTKLNM